MVYDKKKSGDPDFDDKVPAGEHLTVVKAGDGTIVGRLDPSLGPVTPDGAHLPVVDPEELDTRPAPGERAEVKAEVQTYTAEDTPHEEVSLEEAHAPAKDPDTSSSADAPTPDATPDNALAPARSDKRRATPAK